MSPEFAKVAVEHDDSVDPATPSSGTSSAGAEQLARDAQEAGGPQPVSTHCGTDFYRVAEYSGGTPCAHCGGGGYWIIVYGEDRDNETEIGSAWGEREVAEDICDLMNMAFDAGFESRDAIAQAEGQP